VRLLRIMAGVGLILPFGKTSYRFVGPFTISTSSDGFMTTPVCELASWRSQTDNGILVAAPRGMTTGVACVNVQERTSTRARFS
ncbi:MAG TPA: hypothetical protein VJQ82_06065, partial [Terriglobales bacterium]|nr:hypothetical protein [Terriglobales bacterium]